MADEDAPEAPQRRAVGEALLPLFDDPDLLGVKVYYAYRQPDGSVAAGVLNLSDSAAIRQGLTNAAFAEAFVFNPQFAESFGFVLKVPPSASPLRPQTSP